MFKIFKLFFVSFSLMGISNFIPVAASNSDFPKELLPCLPQGKTIKSVSLDAQIKHNGVSYYQLAIKEEIDGIFEDKTEHLDSNTVIQLDRLGCLIRIPHGWDSLNFSKRKFLPEAIANQLALDFTKRNIALAGGREKYEQVPWELEVSDAGDGPWVFFPEDVWAYQQLNLKLPEHYVVVNSWDELNSSSEK